MVASCESATLAQRLIMETCDKQAIEPGQLTVHADRGSSMKSRPVALLLSDLGITKTHSRPYTSDDNPFSESQFKTLKYRPDFPQRFGCIEDARRFRKAFSGGTTKSIGIPASTFLLQKPFIMGLRNKSWEARGHVLSAAHEAHPERFVNGVPSVKQMPGAVWINPPQDGFHIAAREK